MNIVVVSTLEIAKKEAMEKLNEVQSTSQAPQLFPEQNKEV